jgi:hypothetical protein
MRGLALVALIQLLTATGCLTVSTLDHEPTPTPQIEDREDCGEILGTAFHSESERDWFTENCSGWAQATLGRVASGTSLQAPSAPSKQDDVEMNDDRSGPERRPDEDNDPARCARMRGQSYESTSDRDWFLNNCVQLEVVPGESPRCAEIRGRPYESRAQRNWFLSNCTSSSPTARDPDPNGPDRHSCDDIRGTKYRSRAERSWFLKNCTQP